MSKIMNSIYNIYYLDEAASRKTVIHKLNSLVKLIVTAAYLIIVLSFGKYDILGLFPCILYPMIIFLLSEISFFKIFKRALIVFPFVIGIGIFNPVFDTKSFISILGISISFGWISFITLMIKCGLTVTAGLLLISTTGIEKIAVALRKLKVPKLFVTQFLLTYRYIYVLLEEAGRLIKAYSLRAPFHKGVSYIVSGSLLGQMLLRAFDRANRVYNAMLLRGFDGDFNFERNEKFTATSAIYLFSWIIFFIIVRFINIPQLLERWLIR